MVLEGVVWTCFVWIVRRAIVLGGCWQVREDVGCLLFLELSVLEVVVLVVSVFLDPRSYPLKVLTGSVGVGAPVGSLSFRDIWGRSFSGTNDFVRWLIDFHLPWCNTVYAARIQCCSTFGSGCGNFCIKCLFASASSLLSAISCHSCRRLRLGIGR